MESSLNPSLRVTRKEIIFQAVLHILIFIFYAVDRRNPQIEEHEVVFFLNLALVAFFINYILLPKFFYRRRYVVSIILVLLSVCYAVLVEEFILEQIYFPDTRGNRFAGVFYTLLGILPAVTVITGFKFAWDAFWKQRQVETLQETIKESELQFLKSQINPHFLFNNLNNLYAHAIENSPRTPEIILELSAVLRYMLYDCKAAYVPLKKEVEQMHNFIKINELQIEERGQVNFNANTITDTYQIAPLLLIVFIENAFKHSTASQAEDIYIQVDIKTTASGTLEFSCINSYHEQSNTESITGGIGLNNVKKRLQLIYPNAHTLRIIKGENKHEVQLSINLK